MTNLSFNITGKIAKMSELDESKTPRIELSIPEERYYKGETKTVWHNVTVWGDEAVQAAKHLRPGSVITVKIRIDYRKHNGKSYTSLTSRGLRYLSNFGAKRKAS